MKRKLLYAAVLACTAAFIAPVHSFAASYEASSLFNSVGRSETVQDLFFERWETILDRQLYVDWYGKINWVNDFKVHTINNGNGQRQTIPMTLVRSYGSLTIDIPVLGGYDKGDIKKRLSKGSAAKKAGTDEAEEDSGGLVKPKNLQVAFTMTGFHYGLTRKTNVDRGDAGDDSVTDYRFTQFFDDMFVLSVLYTPYIYVHGGLIMNNQIEPNANGTMSYADSKNGFPEYRWFFSSNLLSCLNTNATITKGEVEKMAVGTEVVKIVEFLTKVPKVVPRVTITGKQLALYNDDACDAVWVKSSYIHGGSTEKNSEMADAERQHAKLYTLSLLVSEDFKNRFFADFFAEYQYCPVTLIEKRTMQELDLSPVRELRASAGVNFFGFDEKNISSLKMLLGVGKYWDPAIALHRSEGTGHSLIGYFTTIKYEHPFYGGELTVSYNYSKELRKLVETADKLAFEGALFARF
jgi:hypothetical protein